MNITAIPILGTAISIVIAWALFALFCSYLHEAVAQLKAERGRFLKKYLLQQLQDMPNDINWAAGVYVNGAVDLLSRAPGKPTNEISPKLFASTLIDVVGSSHMVQSIIQHQEGYDPARPEPTALQKFKEAIQVLRPSDVNDLFKQSLRDAEMKANLQAGSNADAATIDTHVYNELAKNLELWYADFLDRVTLWYKKATRGRLFVLGAIVALVINVDSIQLFQHFNNIPTSQAAIIGFYEQNKAELEAAADSLKKTGLDTATFKKAGITINKIDSAVTNAKLPVGTSHNIFYKLHTPGNEATKAFPMFMLRIIGYLISGFAASFGAPFWFDLLKKVYTIKK